MSLATAALTLTQFAIAASIGWIIGQVLLRWAMAGRANANDDYVGLPEQALAGVVGFALFAIALTAANFISGGAVFGSPVPVPIVGAAVLVMGWRLREFPRAVPWLPLAGFAVALVALFVIPVVIGGSGVRTGDPPWHMGWSEQMLAGEPVPTGPAPEYARNAYPWGWHGAIATLVRLVPGSDPLIALEALHLLIVGAIPLAAACLARRIDRRAGWGAGAAAAFIGGFGWIMAGEPDFVATPLRARYGADLVVASPNSVYELLPPALPRELGLVLVAALGVYVAITWRAPGRRTGVASGFLLGLVGLVSIPMLVTGVVWICAGAAVAPRATRLRLLLTTIACATVAMSPWLVPLVIDYVRFGGFVNITPKLGVEWPLPTALWSWGVLLPLAVIGVVVVAMFRRTSGRFVLAFGAGSLVLLALAIARREFGWELAGNPTLLHQGRVWPSVHLLGAALGGVALLTAYRWMNARRAAVVLCMGALAFGAVSPWFASRHLTELIRIGEDGFIYARPDLARGSFVREVGERLGPRDVVLVDESNTLALTVFQFSGARLARFDNPRLADNDLRIRFAELTEAWDEQISAGGFAANYELVRAADAPADAQPLLVGNFGDPSETWMFLEARPQP